MEFPFNTTILWDRTGYGTPKFIKHSEKIVPLSLLPHDIQDLISAARDLDHKQHDFTLHLFHRNLLKQRHVLTPFAMHSLGNSKLCLLRVNNASPSSSMTLSVPLSSYAEAHDSQGNFSLIKIALLQNLAKSISSGRGFCFKNFVRIVASTHKKHPDDSQTTLDETSQTFHFEAIVPAISFQALCINAIPILNSPLCNIIMQSSDPDPTYRMGYFSMNQTRKLVPLLQDDACLCVAPIVGVWVKFDIAEDLAGQALQASFDDALQHPLTWAAAVRYLHSDRIVHRQFVAEDTFLVVLFANGHMRYFEFTHSVGRGRVVEGVPYPFALLDFSVNLQHPEEGSVDESKMEPLMCKFKQVFDISTVDITVRNQSSRPVASSYNGERSFSDLSEAAPLPRSSAPLPSPSPQKPPVAYSQPTLEDDGEEDKSLSIAPGAYSSLHVAVKHGQSSSLPHSGVLSTPAYMDAHALSSPQLQFSFPAEVIAAQQRQIEALREQVASLQHLVEKLTLASLPAHMVDRRNQVETSQVSVGSASVSRGEQAREQVSLLSMRSRTDNAPQAPLPASPHFTDSASLPTSTWAQVMAKEESAVIENDILLAASRLQEDDDNDGAPYRNAEKSQLYVDQHVAASPSVPASAPQTDDQEISYMSLDTLGCVSVNQRGPPRGAHERVSMYETESIMAIEAKYLNMPIQGTKKT